MWKLGNLEINGKVVLAPMAGITTAGYRKFNMPFGVAMAYTEMVSDMGLIYGNAETESYLIYQKTDTPIGIQLFGSSPENLAKALQIINSKGIEYDFIDVNMGCPVPKVTNSGSGSALMQNPKLCGDIIRALKSNTTKPVTAKIRLGYGPMNFLQVINELELAGVDAIAIHGRTRKELYSGEPHWELLKDLRSKMTVPLIVSGNIFTLDDAINAIEITGAEAVMVARGGMGNPFLIKQIDHYFKTGERLDNPSLDEQMMFCTELADDFIADKGEFLGMKMYRTIAPKFFSGFPNSKSLRNKLVLELNTKDDLIRILNEYKNEIYK